MAQQSLTTRQTQTQEGTQKLQLKPLSQAEIRLLRLTQQEFEKDIRDQLDANPALEDTGSEEDTNLDNNDETDSDYRDDDVEKKESENNDDNDYSPEDDYYGERVSDYDPDDMPPAYYEPEDSRERMVADTSSLYEMLSEQASMANLSERESQIMDYLIGSLDNRGFFSMSLSRACDEMEIYQDFITTPQEIKTVLDILKTFDPVGIGAKDLQESLVIQLQALETTSPLKEMAIDILTRSFEDFEKKHYEKLCKRFKIERPTLDGIYKIISHLNPSPAGSVASGATFENTHVTPDFIVRETDNGFTVSLASSRLTSVKLSATYNAYASANAARNSNEIAAIRQQVSEAKLYIAAIKLRQNTLLETMKTIVRLQPEFFHTGESTSLIPMTQIEVAKIIKRDPSVVSGIVSNKFVDTPYAGIIPLSKLFTQSFVNKNGEEVQREKIFQQMRELIDNEDRNNPISDEELAERLQVARRTVAKYRKILNIPTARMRR